MLRNQNITSDTGLTIISGNELLAKLDKGHAYFRITIIKMNENLLKKWRCVIMKIKEQLETMKENVKKLMVVQECLMDYAGSIFVFGNIDLLLNDKHLTIISAIMPKEEFLILNDRIPEWVDEVNRKVHEVMNILVIRDMDKISLEKQEIFLDILDNNQVSTEDLPENLKIILHADKKCEVNFKMKDIVECYEV